MSKYQIDSVKRSALDNQNLSDLFDVNVMVKDLIKFDPMKELNRFLMDLPFLYAQIYLCGFIDGKQEERGKRK